MRKTKYGYILLSLLVLSGLAGAPTNNSLNKKERKVLVVDLKETKTDFLKSIKGLSDKQLDFKASPEKWSIRQCAEHIILSEAGMFQIVEKSLQQQAEPVKRNEIKLTDEQLFANIRDRSFKVKAPEIIQPTGKYKTLKDMVDEFTKLRGDHINYVKITTEDLRNHVSPHPFFGQLDCYQWLLLMSGHSKRHTDQIREVQADPGYPK